MDTLPRDLILKIISHLSDPFYSPLLEEEEEYNYEYEELVKKGIQALYCASKKFSFLRDYQYIILREGDYGLGFNYWDFYDSLYDAEIHGLISSAWSAWDEEMVTSLTGCGYDFREVIYSNRTEFCIDGIRWGSSDQIFKEKYEPIMLEANRRIQEGEIIPEIKKFMETNDIRYLISKHPQ